MTTTHQPELPAPSFRLMWRNAAYYVSEPNIGDTDVYTADQMRAYAATHAASRPADGVPASVKQKWPQRLGYPKPDENGNETGDIGELAYADGWNACLDEAKRMSDVPMPLKGKKGVVVVEDASAPTSAQAGDVPDGFRLVPIIPNEAMIARGEEIIAEDGKRVRPESIYDAMVSGAPDQREFYPKGPRDGWCTKCGCGNDTANFAHLPWCKTPTPDAAARIRALAAEWMVRPGVTDAYKICADELLSLLDGKGVSGG